MKFGGIQKTSFIDFPNKVSTVLFSAGCNLRCPFCHNWKLIIESKGPFLSETQALKILISRKKYVDSVVITGGEPTLDSSIVKFLKVLKKEGFATKIDTNGFFPDTLEESLPHIDYVAMDVKTALDKYRMLGALDTESFRRSIDILKNEFEDYEFRTTVVPGLVDMEDIPKMGEMVRGGRLFVFQQFIPENAFKQEYRRMKPYESEKIAQFAAVMKEYVKEVLIKA
jgi:pyruvate formate lyase activating enzyme